MTCHISHYCTASTYRLTAVEGALLKTLSKLQQPTDKRLKKTGKNWNDKTLLI